MTLAPLRIDLRGTGKGAMALRSIKQKVASLLELPGDVMLDVARLSLIGDMELLIENHRGLEEYNPSLVSFRTPHGRIAVAGENLQIGSISPDGIVVLGKIRHVQYLD